LTIRSADCPASGSSSESSFVCISGSVSRSIFGYGPDPFPDPIPDTELDTDLDTELEIGPDPCPFLYSDPGSGSVSGSALGNGSISGSGAGSGYSYRSGNDSVPVLVLGSGSSIGFVSGSFLDPFPVPDF
jgi:hypothetical protein